MNTQNLEQSAVQASAKSRYLQLLVLVIVAGNIYPLIYLRQNFEVSILESFQITSSQLGEMYAMLGILYVVTYLPSGWLADRVSPKRLMSFSLVVAGALGLWFATFPDVLSLKIIFAGWGVAAGLTFWSALIKATTLLAKPSEQGRFFGILDGGRGLIEAILATIAVAIFAYFLANTGRDTQASLKAVIYLYAGAMLVLAPISYFVLQNNLVKVSDKQDGGYQGDLWQDLKIILTKEEIWLCAICILAGYQLFWATYSFSAYLQTNFGMTAVAVGTITVAKLWMRPLGAVMAGFAGDYYDREKVLGQLLIIAAFSLLALAYIPPGAGMGLLLFIVLAVGFLTYAVRGIFWATLETANVAARIKGLAIGVISLIGYSPDIYLPLLNGYFVDNFSDRQGYLIYYSGIAAFGVVGALAAWRLKFIASRQVAIDENA